MKLNLLSGFLGSGKTTAIQNACNYLRLKDIKTGVITNDQGTKLVDGDFFKSLGIAEEQVTGSCFCCNYNELDKKIESLIKTYNVDTIFAESVGSCTDLVATIFNPLFKFRPRLQVTISTFADAGLLYSLLIEKQCLFDENVNYIYYKQVEEAGIIVVSKIDLIGGVKLEELKQILPEKYKDKIIHYQNSFDKNNVEKWLELLTELEPEAALQSLEIDYDIYGSGEAKLAWLDEEVEVHSIDNNAIEIVIDLINSIFNKIKKHNYSIGHVKFLINGDTKVSFTSSTPDTYVYAAKKQKAITAKLLINARVQTTPESLSKIVSDCIILQERKYSCKISISSLSSFTPGYPRPTYRIASAKNGSKFLITQRFILSLVQAGIEVFRVSSIEEIKHLYQKSGPGIENIVNTIPELGLANAEEMTDIKQKPIYQIWIRGAMGVAETGEIWLAQSETISSLFPFICEYLIIVIDVNLIVANLSVAYLKTEISKENDLPFRGLIPIDTNRKQLLAVSDHKAKSVIVYIIDPLSAAVQKQADCNSECYCYN